MKQVQCPRCQAHNREGARFCQSCGRKLDQQCPDCGNRNNPSAAFCDNCGVRLSQQFPAVSSPQTPPPYLQSPATYTPPHLAERIRAEQTALEAHGTDDGERKTITALFADIKGSTALDIIGFKQG
ncbi:MAG: zinc-ribbon domain-containing protein [Deltaproteobacteria bacterium]|nr:zinc-ribbon domain-containing protein [Deltaproteobacteria bacterium]